MNDMLIVGPRQSSDERSVGGATLLMNSLLDFLEEDKSICFQFISLRKNWFRYGQLIDFPRVFFEVLFKAKGFRMISFHSSWDFALTFGPVLIFFLSLIGKKSCFHFFGGDIHTRVERLPRFYQRWLMSTLFSVSIIHVETKEMVKFFNDNIPAKVFWFPNCRKEYKSTLEKREYSNRFVFLSRVTASKGINEIISVFAKLNNSYIVDFYGPVDNSKFHDQIKGHDNINYCGIVPPEDVRATLSKYDVLLLPSYYSGEGYPGVIIEGFSIGMPVISTFWRRIPEIVVNGKNGLLVNVKSIEELERAVLKIDQNLFLMLRNNALESFRNFDIKYVGSNWVKDVIQFMR